MPDITFNERPFLEVELQVKDQKDSKDIISWCEEKCTFTHMDEAEFIFWIPQFEGYQKALPLCFPNTPEIIEQVLIQAIHKRIGKKDPGYVLIRFVE